MNASSRKSLRYAGYATGCILSAIAFVWLCGLMIPSRHEASASLRVEAAPEAVLAVLAAVEGYPRWRSDVAEVEAPVRGPTADGGEGVRSGPDMGLPAEYGAARRWRETDGAGRVTEHEAGEVSGSGNASARKGPGSAYPRMGGSGKWVERSTTADGRVRVERTFLIVAEGETGTRVALMEKTDLADPFARFRARFVSGYAEDLNALLNGLRKRLGE
jgi:hypothetical protein